MYLIHHESLRSKCCLDITQARITRYVCSYKMNLFYLPQLFFALYSCSSCFHQNWNSHNSLDSLLNLVTSIHVHFDRQCPLSLLTHEYIGSIHLNFTVLHESKVLTSGEHLHNFKFYKRVRIQLRDWGSIFKVMAAKPN